MGSNNISHKPPQNNQPPQISSNDISTVLSDKPPQNIQPPQISSNNISTVLSKNMLGCVLEFVKLNTLPTLGRLNKKFNIVIFKENKLPLFHEFIEEKRHLRSITNKRDIFWGRYSKTSYISEFRKKLLDEKYTKTYTSSQIKDLEIEIMNSILMQFSSNGELDLRHNDLGSNVENIKTLSDALKVNKTLTTLVLAYNNLGSNVENIKSLSDALKVNKTLTTLDLSFNDLGESDYTELSQFKNLEIVK